MIDERSTLEDVCFSVSTALAECGIDAVLTGGSAAAMYAPTEYMSEDADFVLDADDPLDDVAKALKPLGYERYGRSRMFVHSRSRFTLDYPKGPLAVGGDYVQQTATKRRGKQRLRLLTRFDVIRDRLAHFYYWNDYTALNVAVAVGNSVERKEIGGVRSWTERESPLLLAKFGEFERRLAMSPRPVRRRRRGR